MRAAHDQPVVRDAPVLSPTRNDSNSARLETLLTICQIVNSSFPSGSFSHSYGLEKLIVSGEVNDAATVEGHCRSWLRYGLCTADGVAAAHAFRAASQGDMEKIVDIDRRIGCMRLTRETRIAATLTGKAFLAGALVAINSPLLDRLRDLVEGGQMTGQHPVVFGAAMAVANIGEDEGIAVFLQSSFSSLVGVAGRLVPLGQSDVQAILARARRLMIDCVRTSQSRDLDHMSSAVVQFEIASMQHERQLSRLCIS